MAMAKQEGGGGGSNSNSNWEGMLKRWSLEQGTRRAPISAGSVFDHPANSDITHRPAPKWRGVAQKRFADNPPHPGYDLPDRVYDIVCSFWIPPDSDSDSDSDSESADEVKKEVKGDVEDECEIQDESEFQDEDEDEDEDEEAEVEDKDKDKYKEDLLDELQAYVEFVDVAKVLYIDSCLSSFLRAVLSNKQVAGIRAKGAEVVTTMVQNNPTSQQLVIKEKGLRLLLHNFTKYPDATSRTKALGAISSLIRNNEPGITAFRQANGYAALRDALSSESVRFQREALNLIQYLLHENSSDCNIVTELGLPRIMMHLASSDNAEVREAALRGLLVLARDEGGNSGQLVKNDDKLKQVLQELIKRISAMASEDLVAAREEIQLVDSLWNTCYNEPSSLGEKGLLVLPGKDAPARDVASKLFEPPLRALAAPEAADRNSVCEKDGNIVTELGLPRIMIHLASSDDAEVREAALRGLLGLARNEGGNNGRLVKNDDKLKQVLQARIEGISAMAPEDLGAAREERQLVDSLWNACYNEPSSLVEKGLLVLPGEDTPAPDVASKLFEPPLRVWAAAEPADRNYVSEKKEDPLLLGFGSPSAAATPSVQSNSSSKRKKSDSSSKRKKSDSSSKRKKSDSRSKRKESNSSSKRKKSDSSSKRKESNSSSNRKKSDSSSKRKKSDSSSKRKKLH